jgi:hypothetical protein
VGIFAHPPFVTQNGSAVNVCFQNGEKIVSLSLDDSCGRMSHLGRGSIELHRKSNPGPGGGVEIVTHEVFNSNPSYPNEIVPATNENLTRALGWMNRMAWGFDAQGEIPGETNIPHACSGGNLL